MERTVRELEHRLATNLEQFEKALAEADAILRGLHSVREAARPVSTARLALKNIRSIVLSLKDMEERMVQIVRFERNLLDREKKAA